MYATGGWVQAQPQYTWAQPAAVPVYGQAAVPQAWGYATQPAAYDQYGQPVAQPAAYDHYGQPVAAYPWGQAPPTPQAVQYDPVDLFTQELGIAPDEAVHFGWIAEYGLQSEVLPPGWTNHVDPSTGRYFYANNDTGTTSWENPITDCLRGVVEIGRGYLHRPTDTYMEDQIQLLWDQHKRELDAWHGPMMDDEGKSYYINSSSGVASRQDPRVETQFFWELEKTVLEALRDTMVVPEPEEAAQDDLPVFGLTDEELLARLESPLTSPQNSREPPQILRLDSPQLDSPTSWEETRTPRGSSWSRSRTQVELARERTDLAGRVHVDHKSEYKKMIKTLNGVDYIVKEEEEVQKLIMSRKLRERRERKRQLEKEEYERKYAEEWQRSLEAMEAQRREEELRKKAEADAEEQRKANEFRQQQQEEKRQAEERRKEEEERKAAEEERQRVLAEKAAKLEEEKRAAEEARQRELAEKAAQEEAERKAEEARRAREELIARLRAAVQSRNTEALRSAIAEAEAAGLTHELEPLRKALQEELARRRAAAVKARKAAEKLASEFSSAKDAQDCGGPTLAAQWRAAVKEVAKPFDEEQLLCGAGEAKA